jgi:HD superfamily phosphohydrolase
MAAGKDVVKFYDPLYELNVFSNSHSVSTFRLFFEGRNSEERNFYEEVLNTYEMGRLFHLKQSGLAFLIFPSATHNRFAHSIGTWTLGTLAMSESKVLISPSRRDDRPGRGIEFESLSNYLSGPENSPKGLSFLMSLLVHDIAHKPFSHILENNESMIKAGVKTHEESGIDIIQGNKEAPIFASYQKRAESMGLPMISTVLKEYEDKGMLSVKTISDLLEGGQKEDSMIQLLHELVSGVVDLDRLDHYNRDSYFTGVKLAGVGIRGILENIIIDPSEKRIYIHEDGVNHVLHLLFAKELLWKEALDSDRIRSYDTMLNRAVSIYLDSNATGHDTAYDIASSMDDELVSMLRTGKDSRDLIDRIMSRRAYLQMWNGPTNWERSRLMGRFSEFLNDNKLDPNRWLIHVPQNYGRTPSWMNLNVYKRDGQIGQIGENNPTLINYFEGQESLRSRRIRVFVHPDEQKDRDINRLKQTLNGYLMSA